MTNEEALEILNGNKDVWRELGYESIREFNKDWDIAFNMAIKALEQQPVIDKIEEEIKSPNRGTCDYFIVDRIEEIINKYKAENEVQE